MAQDTFTDAMERYRDGEEAFREQRARMLEDIEFSNPADPKQWPEDVLAQRQSNVDGARPCLTLDHTNQYIRQVVNDSRQNKPGLEALPASGGSRIEVARAIEGMFRHIEYRSRAQIAYDAGIEHAARMGLGWIRVMPEVVNAKLNWQEARICRIHNPLAIVSDPDWREPDGSDLMWVFAKSMLAKKAFKKRWPKANLTAFDPKGSGASWFQESSIQIAEHLVIEEKKSNRFKLSMPDGSTLDDVYDDSADEAPEGKKGFWKTVNGELGGTKPPFTTYESADRTVRWLIMSGAEILEETVFPSRWTGFVPVLGTEIWVDEKRYLSGMVRAMREAQQAYNYERSAYVESVALQPKAPILAAAEAMEGHEDEWAVANRSNKAFLPWNAYTQDGSATLPKPERLNPPAFPVAFAQGAQFADNDIQASIGMYRASLGAPAPETSGVALRQKRLEGDTANFHYGDNQRVSIEMVGRIVIDMLPRLYDEPREARILGVDGLVKPVRIDPTGSAYTAHPNGAQTINLGTGEYDVRCKAGPSYTTLRGEAADALTDLMGRSPAFAAAVGPLWAEMQDWPNADRLAKALLAMAPPPVQAALSDQGSQDPKQLQQQVTQLQGQLQHMQQLVEQAGQQLQQAQASEREAHFKALTDAAKARIDQYNAETQRLKVIGAGMTAEQVQVIVMQTLQDALAQGGFAGTSAPAGAQQVPADDGAPQGALPTGFQAVAPPGPAPAPDGGLPEFPLAHQPPAPPQQPQQEPPPSGSSAF